MIDLSHNLFLLMLNLSQVNSRERIMDLFLEALASLLPELFIGQPQPDLPAPLESLEVSTPQRTFGRLEVRGPARAYPPEVAAQVRNAARMVAILLENRLQAELLAGDNQRLEEAVSNRLQDLERTATDLQAEIVRRQESEALYRDLVEALPQAVFQIDTDGRLLFANRALLERLNVTLEQALGKTTRDFYPPEMAENYTRLDARVMENRETLTLVEENYIPASGRSSYIEIVKIPLIGAGGQVTGIQGIYWDISERVQFERTLRASEEKYRRLFEEQLDAIFLADMETGILLDANRAAQELTGWSRDELVGQHQSMLHPPEDLLARFTPTFEKHRAKPDTELLETRLVTRSGQIRQVTIKGTHLELNGRRVLQGIFKDITAAKQVEQAFKTSEKRFRATFMESPIGMALYSPGEILLEINPAYQRILGILDEELPKLIGQPRASKTVPEHQRQLAEGQTINFQTVLDFETIRQSGVYQPARSGVCHLDLTITPIHSDGVHINNLVLVQEFTARREAEEALRRSYSELQTQNSRLSVLHNIDFAISSHFSLKDLLDGILEQTTRLEGIDAAFLLLPDDEHGSLGLAEVSGLDAERKALEKVTWMDTRGGEALNSGRAIFGSLDGGPSALQQHYAGAAWLPLKVQNQVRGVLVILCRGKIVYDQGLVGFLEALALQTAIALDNAGLVYRLQLSNFELTSAYGATIEGWSKALELRDKETKGHSHRVLPLTMEMALRMGIDGDALVHLRRGTLLHDIGKMGIPDAILGKPGALTPDEWVIMRQHPRYAYDLLSGIAYLHPALDIPYCHHERWDGSGYPRHLKGTEIPLAARIFAVVDVWDALNTDRPYRPAWPRQEVISYLKDQAGRHFDPEVVSVFLEMLGETGEDRE